MSQSTNVTAPDTGTEINIGIEPAARSAIAQGLSRLLADSYTLYLKTHYYHWNVTGQRFRDLHLMFEEQYTELSVAVDDIAERIRTLGAIAPGSYSAFARLSQVQEDDTPTAPDASAMLRTLVADNETVVRTARETLGVAQESADESSASLLSDRMVVHEKAAWMLRSMLD